MFERFTDTARLVVVLAQEEARRLDHDEIGTEHILIGLLDLDEGTAAKALDALGISLEPVRRQVEDVIGRGGSPPGAHIPYTPGAKKALELARREALQLGHNEIGTAHILLGLIREGEGVAARVLVKVGADLSSVRQQVAQLRRGGRRPSDRSPVDRLAGQPAGPVELVDGGSGITLAMALRSVAPLVAVLPVTRDPRVRLALVVAQQLAVRQGPSPLGTSVLARFVPANLVPTNGAEVVERVGRLLAVRSPVTQTAAALLTAGARMARPRQPPEGEAQ